MPKSALAHPQPWYRRLLNLALGAIVLSLGGYVVISLTSQYLLPSREPVVVMVDAPHVTPAGTTYVGENWREGEVDGSTSRAQQLLNEQGVVTAQIVFVDAPCGNQPEERYLNGCVDKNDPSTIYLAKIGADDTALSDEDLRALVIHEAAHIKQLSLSYDFFSSNPAVVALFPGNDSPSEPLADCMTEALLGYQLHTYIESCSPDQLSMAASVWN